MKIVFVIIGLLVLMIVVFAIYRFIIVKRQNSKLNVKRFERVKELYQKLENGEDVTEQNILPYAQNRLTRQTAFQLLEKHNKVNLFPKEYYSIIKGAESSLANWLEFPTELDACPDEIEHIKRVTFDYDGENNFVHYEVFKYLTYEPHWASKVGWCLGVVGPYFDDSKPYDFAQATFSRIDSKLKNVTADEEAKWVHDNISMRR
ncbi:hypothetical protein BC749_12021 [Flavobacterium araucananum]|uniref:Uncharacterized protein n=1 Tax=Flavobacterium araucananum TaxID=946678 RepID=A0A227NN06_9FLAO|nr:hypothetical protein [Flavobacterium araucananum]OXE98198.1 hypothetical protein B0A64_22640 [Flavobacterium araucananum]PWJ90656.1 hypothetical protein BC749_12021 [Flavobacterium araucananum]